MHHHLQKALNLAKKTGDRLIVLDSAKPDNVYVVMLFDEYEKLAIGRNEIRGLTEDELLDKINRDIAIWKSEQKNDENISLKPRPTDYQYKADDSIYKYDKSEESMDYFNDPEDDDYEEFDNFDNEDEEREPVITNPRKIKQKKTHWRIPDSRKEGAEEIIEEDRQYLEDINY